MADDAGEPAAEPVKTGPSVARTHRLKNGALAGNGRPKGRKNTSTLVREQLGGKDVLEGIEDGIPQLQLKPFVFRVAALLKHRNGFVRLGTEKFLYEALHGKPKQQIEANVTIKDPHERLRRAAELAAQMRDGSIEATVVPEVDARLLPAAAGGNGNGGNGHHE